MFNTKKVILGLSVLTLLSLGLANAELTDIQNHHYKPEIEALYQKGCFQGYSDNTFKPDKKISRVETIKVILSCLDLPEIYSEEKFKLPKNAVIKIGNQEQILESESEVTFKLPFNPNLYSDLNFSDIDNSSWYIPYLKEAMVRKIITGYVDNSFKPNAVVTKKDFYTMLYRTIPENLKEIPQVDPRAKDLDKNDWFYEGLQFALVTEILDTDKEGFINPNRELNRGHVAKFLHEYLKWEEKKINPINEVIKEIIKEIPDENFEEEIDQTPETIDTSTLTPALSEDKVGFKTSGKASYYADSLAGETTASGDIYDPERLMAAHKTIPFGSLVKVTNVSNGKWVKVVIADRGPFAKNRLIDLSKSAFKALDDTSKGILNVEIEIIEAP